MIGNTAFSISIPDIQILPSSFQSTDLKPSYAAYWQKDNHTKLTKPLDVSSLDSLPDFIKFYSDPGLFNFTLQTNEVQNEGLYTLVFVK